nr:uncharacterized protein LOC124220464 [Neodiprion pinetum]
MKRDENVSDFYDRLKILISAARVALEDEYGKTEADAVMKVLQVNALDAYIRGLPEAIERYVEGRVKTLEEAFKLARKTENRMRQGIISSGETQRVQIPRPNSPMIYNQNNAPRLYSNYGISDGAETRARSPSPNAAMYRHPTANVADRRSPEPRGYYPYEMPAHSQFQHQQPRGYQYPPYFPQHPYYYPPMTYPYLPPYGYPPTINPASIPQRSGSPGANLNTGRSNSNVRTRSPSPRRTSETAESLNLNATRRPDATARYATTERQPTVRFAEPPAGATIRADQIENRH